MKKFFSLLAGGVMVVSVSVTTPAAPSEDRPVGYLPDGTPYLADEVLFCLKQAPSQALSPAGANRRAINPAALAALDPSILAVVANHRAAAHWLRQRPRQRLW